MLLPSTIIDVLLLNSMHIYVSSSVSYSNAVEAATEYYHKIKLLLPIIFFWSVHNGIFYLIRLASEQNLSINHLLFG